MWYCTLYAVAPEMAVHLKVAEVVVVFKVTVPDGTAQEATVSFLQELIEITDRIVSAAKSAVRIQICLVNDKVLDAKNAISGQKTVFGAIYCLERREPGASARGEKSRVPAKGARTGNVIKQSRFSCDSAGVVAFFIYMQFRFTAWRISVIC